MSRKNAVWSVHPSPADGPSGPLPSGAVMDVAATNSEDPVLPWAQALADRGKRPAFAGSGVGVRPGSRASPGPFPKWWHRVTLPPPCLCVPGPRQRFVSPSQTSATPTASQRPGTTFRFVSPVSEGPLKRMQIKRSGACSPTLCKI